MMSLKQAKLLFWAVFIGYAIWKYAASAPTGFNLPYIASVALLVLITAVLPFLIARAIGRRVGGHAKRTIITLLVGVLASVAGYSAFWAIFIAPSGADVALAQVATRGIGWGLAFGGLASIWNSARDH